MIRTASLALLCLAFVLTVVGCGGPKDPPKPDMPLKTSEGGADKKGKKSKSIEASLEDPPKR